MREYGLDPMHYTSLPAFSWDACLKFTKTRPELIQDQDMYTFFERGIRGGVSMIPRRYADSSNGMSSMLYFGKIFKLIYKVLLSFKLNNKYNLCIRILFYIQFCILFTILLFQMPTTYTDWLWHRCSLTLTSCGYQNR